MDMVVQAAIAVKAKILCLIKLGHSILCTAWLYFFIEKFSLDYSMIKVIKTQVNSLLKYGKQNGQITQTQVEEYNRIGNLINYIQNAQNVFLIFFNIN